MPQIPTDNTGRCLPARGCRPPWPLLRAFAARAAFSRTGMARVSGSNCCSGKSLKVSRVSCRAHNSVPDMRRRAGPVVGSVREGDWSVYKESS